MTTAIAPEGQSGPGQAPTELSPAESPMAPEAGQRQPGRTRSSAAWFGLVAAALMLVLLLIFILQNTRSVKITYFTVTGTIPVGVALLFAAIGGLLLAGLVSLRIWQLHHRLTQGAK